MAERAPSFPTRDFTRLWWAESVSTLGSNITLLALSTIVVLTLDGTAQDVGWLNSARWLPYLVVGLLVGALVDRYRRRPLMIGADLARALLLAVIPIAWAADLLTLPLLLALTLGLGTASLVGDAAAMSFLPRVVPAVHLQRAHARIDATDAVAQSGGPALAGLLIKVAGAPVAVLVDALSYVVSAVLVLRIRVAEASPTPGPRPHVLREIRDGVRWVYRGSGLLVLAVTTHVWFVANAILGAVLAPYVLVTLGLSPFQFGLATACAGIGGVLGALASTAGGRILGTGGVIIGSHALTALGALVMVGAGLGTSGWAAVAVLAVGQACWGIGLSFGNSHESAYRQAITPDALRARTITTMRSFNRAIIVVGAPLGGLLAVATTNRTALVVATAIFAAVPLMLLASPIRRLRYDYADGAG
ncbi:MFS transporter [Nocardioides sp. GXZ039]|uniref:MFS transporter n=1 Tax=Nocardioides sp. GXZ039 TaxID=3136018 RepID=UPI0030F3DC62